MSLFKKPKKAAQQSRRLFTSEVENMDVDEEDQIEAEIKQKKKEKKDKDKSSKPQKSSLLSFGDEGILIDPVTFNWDDIKLYVYIYFYSFIYNFQTISI